MKFIEIFITAKHTYITYLKNTHVYIKQMVDKVSKCFRAKSNVDHKLKMNVCTIILKGLLLHKKYKLI